MDATLIVIDNDAELARTRRGMTGDTAFRLAPYSHPPDFWINLQARYDLDAAKRKLRGRMEREVPRVPPEARGLLDSGFAAASRRPPGMTTKYDSDFGNAALRIPS
jgi:hypothetical protein